MATSCTKARIARGRHVGALLVAFAVATLGGPAQAVPSDPEARRHFEAGSAHFAQERWDEAADAFEQSYAAEEDLTVLYAWAQAERLAGHCREAVRLYNQFIASRPSAEAEQAAKEGIVACADALAAEPMVPDEPTPSDEPATEPDPEPIVSTPPLPEPDKGSTKKPKNKDAWYRDPAGGALVAAGVVGAGVGTGLLVAAQLRDNQKDPTYGDFVEKLEQVKRLRIAGGVTLGVGGALLIGGIVRWAVVGTRSKRQTAVVPAFDGRSTSLVFATRF